MDAIRSWRRRLPVAVLSLLLVLILAGCALMDGAGPPDSWPPQGHLVVSYLDVGQGDASLLQGENCTMLIDAGRHDRQDLLPLLRQAGVTALDLLVLTHPHADHIGQAAQVLRTLPVAEVWMSGWEHTTATFERTVDALLESEAGYMEPRAGDTHWCGPLFIEVLNPSEPLTDIHDNLALRVTFGQVAFLWTGDAETRHEEAILATGLPVRAHVMLLGHHGSSTSSGRRFLEAVNPGLAIYSAGRGNDYGHPHREVMDRLEALGIPVYGTRKARRLRPPVFVRRWSSYAGGGGGWTRLDRVPGRRSPSPPALLPYPRHIRTPGDTYAN